MIETVFLAVLVLGLFLGNAFLSLTDPKRLARQAVRRRMLEAGQAMLPEQGREMQAGPFEAEDSEAGQALFSRQGLGNSFNETASGEKISYLSKRIDRLEQLLLKIDKSKFIAQKLDRTNLSQKLSDLDEFKQNTGLEIAALKQRLDKVVPAKKKKPYKGPDISDEKLREIVFRTTH